MPKVAVVIPVYKQVFSEYEKISINSIYQSFSKTYDIIYVKPQTLDFTPPHSDCTLMECFEDDYFKGIRGYNHLMLSAEFYARFSEYEYILIAQADCYIFRDELLEWCDKGYDYIGAPWLVRPIYNNPFMRVCSAIKRCYCNVMGLPNSQVTNNKVGNGGLSLRNVASCLRAVTELEDVAKRYLSYPKKCAVYNEDVFFALEPNRAGLGFKYFTPMEALRFSVDKYPALCYKLLGEKLPMGTHGWYKRRMIDFWSPIILNNK